MTISTDDLLNSILESLERIDYIKSEDIPNIDLYMDQVTTFMDKRMKAATRKPKEDKILTKTMINNYAKNDLLPPPIKKKYTKEHMLLLIFIYYFKGILSIGDIQTLLGPLSENFFGKDKEFGLEQIYEEVFSLEREQVKIMKADVADSFKKAQGVFDKAPEQDQEFLKQFAFICMLSFDVYVKKLMIEKMIDNFKVSMEEKEKEAAAKPSKEKEKKPEEL